MIRRLKYFGSLFVLVIFSACQSNNTEIGDAGKPKTDSVVAKGNSVFTNECAAYFAEVLKHDSIIMNATEVDVKVANAAIKAFTDFSFYCKEDTIAPVMLMKASQIATTINNLPQAQLCLEKCISDFPNFYNRGAAYFLLARLYDEPTQLNNEAKAEELYHLVKSQYPNTPWAKDADAALMQLGKTDADIIKEFEKKNKKK